jgi:hypothetical protein
MHKRTVYIRVNRLHNNNGSNGSDIILLQRFQEQWPIYILVTKMMKCTSNLFVMIFTVSENVHTEHHVGTGSSPLHISGRVYI